MTSEMERRLELLNAEIDGEPTAPERAELSRELLADPALRALREGLRRTCEAIDSIPSEDPPQDLAAAVMASLPPGPPVCEGTADDRQPRGRFGRPVLAYAAAVAGGLIVSALAFHFGLDQRGLESRELAGTLAPTARSRLELALDGVRGTIELQGTTGAPVLRTSLVATQHVQVIARLGEQEVRLSGFAAAHHEPVVRIASFSAATGGAPVVVDVEVRDEASGAVLRQARLRPDDPN